jgi:hypothetical protein
MSLEKLQQIADLQRQQLQALQQHDLPGLMALELQKTALLSQIDWQQAGHDWRQPMQVLVEEQSRLEAVCDDLREVLGVRLNTLIKQQRMSAAYRDNE